MLYYKFSIVTFLYKCGFAVIFRIFQCLYVSVASPCRTIPWLRRDIQNISMFICKCGFAVLYYTTQIPHRNFGAFGPKTYSYLSVEKEESWKESVHNTVHIGWTTFLSLDFRWSFYQFSGFILMNIILTYIDL